MKKYAEILKDIAAARAGMIDTAKTEKDNAECDAYRAKVRH